MLTVDKKSRQHLTLHPQREVKVIITFPTAEEREWGEFAKEKW
jgi:hypothetical protein